MLLEFSQNGAIYPKKTQHTGFSYVVHGIESLFFTEVRHVAPAFKTAPPALKLFAESLAKVPDPRSKQGVCHPSTTLLTIVLLGLLAKVSTPA
jgi:hypothetical protein